MTIFRVENPKTKNGPYIDRDRYLTKRLINELANHYHKNGHPNTYNDKGIGRWMGDSEFSGFKTIGQLVKWFGNRLLRELLESGFEIVEIEAEVTAESDMQLLFRR